MQARSHMLVGLSLLRDTNLSWILLVKMIGELSRLCFRDGHLFMIKTQLTSFFQYSSSLSIILQRAALVVSSSNARSSNAFNSWTALAIASFF